MTKKMKICRSNVYAFASTFYFLFKHKSTAEKNKKSLKASTADNCSSLTRQISGRTEARVDNSGYKKLAVQCFSDRFMVNQSLVLHINICCKIRHLSQARNL